MTRWHLTLHLRFAILAAGLSAAAAPALAEPNAEADKLKLLESMGRRAHAEERYEDAIDAFEAAYLMRADPRYLYNIGRCHERLGHIEKAIEHLELYLEQVEGPKDTADAEAVLAVLRVRVQKAGTEGAAEPDSYPELADEELPPPPPGPEPEQPAAERAVPPPGAAVTEPAPPGGSGLGWPTVAALASGGALLLGGAVFGVLARSAEDRRDGLRGTEPVPAVDFIEADDEARRDALVANALLGAGAAAAAAGVGLWLLDSESRAHRAVCVGVLPVARGIGLTVEVGP